MYTPKNIATLLLLAMLLAACGRKEFTEEMRCEDTCIFSGDGECDDGGEQSDFNYCEIGTDCSDCGSRVVQVEVE